MLQAQSLAANRAGSNISQADFCRTEFMPIDAADDAFAPRFVYITCSTHEEAALIGRALVEEQLAASINILGPARSIYSWRGRIEDAEEFIVIAKTRQGCVDKLTARVRALHSYECPCIVALPIVAGYPDYVRWLVEVTGGSEEGGGVAP